MSVQLERAGQRPLEFDGWRAAEVSTFQEGKPRWTELRLWVPDEPSDVSWVVESVGRSLVEGEVDRRDAKVCRSYAELKAALSKGGLLTKPGHQLIMQGAEEDELLEEHAQNDLRKAERL